MLASPMFADDPILPLPSVLVPVAIILKGDEVLGFVEGVLSLIGTVSL